MNRRRRRTVRPRPLPVHDQDHIHTTSACRKLCSILFHHALGDSGAVCSCLLACRNLRTFALSKVFRCLLISSRTFFQYPFAKIVTEQSTGPGFPISPLSLSDPSSER